MGSYLQKLGYSIICTNYRAAGGEIDIIALNSGVLVIIEVKSGREDAFVLAASVTPDKRKRIERACKAFIYQNKMYDLPVHFEVITVTMPSQKLQHFRREFFDD